MYFSLSLIYLKYKLEKETKMCNINFLKLYYFSVASMHFNKYLHTKTNIYDFQAFY